MDITGCQKRLHLFELEYVNTFSAKILFCSQLVLISMKFQCEQRKWKLRSCSKKGCIGMCYWSLATRDRSSQSWHWKQLINTFSAITSYLENQAYHRPEWTHHFTGYKISWKWLFRILSSRPNFQINKNCWKCIVAESVLTYSAPNTHLSSLSEDAISSKSY